MTRSVVRIACITLAALCGGTALAQPPAVPAPPPRPVGPPEPAPTAGTTLPIPGAGDLVRPVVMGSYGYAYLPPRLVYGPSFAPTAYPYYGGAVVVGYGGGYLPPRAVYGPSVSPTAFPYPGYAAVSPYPRTVSSYSSGPSAYPPVGRVGRW
jgi:hypothetical protein